MKRTKIPRVLDSDENGRTRLVVRETELHHTDGGHHKFYRLRLIAVVDAGEISVFILSRTWGRIGSKGRTLTDAYKVSAPEARAEKWRAASHRFSTLRDSKFRKGYDTHSLGPALSMVAVLQAARDTSVAQENRRQPVPPPSGPTASFAEQFQSYAQGES